SHDRNKRQREWNSRGYTKKCLSKIYQPKGVGHGGRPPHFPLNHTCKGWRYYLYNSATKGHYLSRQPASIGSGLVQVERKRVLVVDNEPDVLEAIVASLELSGYAVIAADSPLKALELCE